MTKDRKNHCIYYFEKPQNTYVCWYLTLLWSIAEQQSSGFGRLQAYHHTFSSTAPEISQKSLRTLSTILSLKAPSLIHLISHNVSLMYGSTLKQECQQLPGHAQDLVLDQTLWVWSLWLKETDVPPLAGVVIYTTEAFGSHMIFNSSPSSTAPSSFVKVVSVFSLMSQGSETAILLLAWYSDTHVSEGPEPCRAIGLYVLYTAWNILVKRTIAFLKFVFMAVSF